MDRRTEVCSTIAALAAAIYVAVLVALPVVDRSFDALATHPEDYAGGRLGFAVNLSYLALAVALLSFVLSVLPIRGTAIVLPILIAPPTVLCAALAVDPIGVARGNPIFLLPIVCLATVPLVGSIVLRDRLGGWRSMLGGLATVVLLAFAALLVAPDAVGGLVNRAFDVTLGLWLLLAAVAVRHGSARRLSPG